MGAVVLLAACLAGLLGTRFNTGLDSRGSRGAHKSLLELLLQLINLIFLLSER